MTNLEALKSAVHFPLSNLTLEKIMINRELDKDGVYTSANSGTIELCVADSIKVMLTSPNISESDFSISMTEKETLKKMANEIYEKNGEPSPFVPIISTVKAW